jgi:hypothetical protein
MPALQDFAPGYKTSGFFLQLFCNSTVAVAQPFRLHCMRSLFFLSKSGFSFFLNFFGSRVLIDGGEERSG